MPSPFATGRRMSSHRSSCGASWLAPLSALICPFSKLFVPPELGRHRHPGRKRPPTSRIATCHPGDADQHRALCRRRPCSAPAASLPASPPSTWPEKPCPPPSFSSFTSFPTSRTSSTSYGPLRRHHLLHLCPHRISRRRSPPSDAPHRQHPGLRPGRPPCNPSPSASPANCTSAATAWHEGI